MSSRKVRPQDHKRWLELQELMETPPGGHGHGRERNEQGGWMPLETNDIPSTKHYLEARTAARNRTIRAMLTEGYSTPDVAAKLGITVRRVQMADPGRKKGRPEKRNP